MQLVDQPGRQQLGLQAADELVESRDLLGEVLEKHQFRLIRLKRPLLHEGSAGEHLADAAVLDAEVHHFG